MNIFTKMTNDIFQEIASCQSVASDVTGLDIKTIKTYKDKKKQIKD